MQSSFRLYVIIALGAAGFLAAAGAWARSRRKTPEQFERTATQRMFGTLTVLQWLRSFYRHDRMHADQIGGREPEYRPRFTGAEPNQRSGGRR